VGAAGGQLLRMRMYARARLTLSARRPHDSRRRAPPATNLTAELRALAARRLPSLQLPEGAARMAMVTRGRHDHTMNQCMAIHTTAA
jgi:hypothetical protein